MKKKREKNQKGGIINSPVEYLKNRTGCPDDEFVVEKSVIIDDIRTDKCSRWGEVNNCTLTALTNILVHYRKLGFDNIPESETEVYGVVRKQAGKLKFSEKGLPVYKNSAIVKKVWRNGLEYVEGKGSSRYLWTHKQLLNEIDNNRPFLFSLAKGVYFDHTIAIYGYEVYKHCSTGKKYTFLVAADGWSDERRYLAFSGLLETYVACATLIRLPKEKQPEKQKMAE